MPLKSTPSRTPRSSRTASSAFSALANPRTVAAASATTNGTHSSSAKRKRNDDASVYDDFEGAHEVERTPVKKARMGATPKGARVERRKENGEDGMLSGSKKSVRGSNETPKKGSVGQSSVRSSGRKTRAVVEVEEEDADEGEGGSDAEEPAQVGTPAKKSRSTAAQNQEQEQLDSGSRRSTRTSRPSRKQLLVQQDLESKTINGSRTSGRSKADITPGRQRAFLAGGDPRGVSEVPDSEEEGVAPKDGHQDEEEEDELASNIGTPIRSAKRRKADTGVNGMTPSAKVASGAAKGSARSVSSRTVRTSLEATDDVPGTVVPEDDVFTRSTRKNTRTQTPTKLTRKLRQASPLPFSSQRELANVDNVPAPATVRTPRKALAKLTRMAGEGPKLKLPTATSDGDDFARWKRAIIERVTGRSHGPLVGLDDEYAKVYQLALNTVEAGEGNSMLLIGARGSGKSVLLDEALQNISNEHPDEFYTIRLNGFIHTDDKIALREIWRQLGKEMEVEDDGKNYADTLLKLLALLSHPTESGTEDADQVAKAVVFVIDEFDLFATHPRQTLLYNLFDIAQSRKAPIAVFGLTTRIDVGESLEKRVKSRFSHRYVHTSLARSVAQFGEMCLSALTVTDELNAHSTIFASWNDVVKDLFADSHFITTILSPHYYHTKSVASFLTTLHPALATLQPANFPSQPTDLLALITSSSTTALLTPPNSKLHLLPSLSTLALSLLIAACRLDIILDSPTCNFNMCYAEYVSLASKARIQAAASGAKAVGAGTRVWGREVARREWERLVGWELLMPVVVVGAGVTGTAMVRADVSLEECAVVGRERGWERVLEGWCRHV